MTLKPHEIKKQVRDRYARAAKKSESCCGPAPCGGGSTGRSEDSTSRLVGYSAEELAGIPADAATVLVNHYPLRFEDVIIPKKPRYAPWCGTRATADWHRRFRARAVVYGHLHLRASRYADGVHFQEVSLGYPRQWDQALPADAYLRRVL